MEHKLKTWPEYFEEVIEGRKTFEVRKNDRDFKEGDTLLLQEFDPETEEYTGMICRVEVTYILEGGNFGVEFGYVIMAIQ
jgi:ASC-1-like (ASCH) protein